MDKIAIIIISIIIGLLYYYNMSASIPKESNCSFSANIWTDIGAFIVGIAILYLGYYKYDDNILIVSGTAIITEHIAQLFHNKLGLFEGR